MQFTPHLAFLQHREGPGAQFLADGLEATLPLNDAGKDIVERNSHRSGLI